MMPSKTFYNLKEEKKEKLLNAALKEFSTTELEKVSINKIIMDAKIPRGSFYMYFDSKYDLFDYVLSGYRDIFVKLVSDTLIENEGDLRNCFSTLYDKLFIRMKKIDLHILFKNVFKYINSEQDFFQRNDHFLFNDISSLINKKDIATKDLEFIFSLLMHNLVASCFHDLGNKKISKDNYLRKLDILCYGIYVREKR